MVKREYPIITICGSTKFKDDIQMMREKLTLEGFIVLGPEVYSHTKDGKPLNEDIIKEFKKMSRQKIDMSDIVFVVNSNHYIGEDTKDEIKYAKKQGKKIIYLEN